MHSTCPCLAIVKLSLPSPWDSSDIMLFSVYLALLFVSGRHVHSYVVASGQQYEPARVKKWIWRFGLERLSLRRTRQYIRGIGAVATSLTACDAPRLRFSSRDTHHEQIPVRDVLLRRIEASERFADHATELQPGVETSGRVILAHSRTLGHTSRGKGQAVEQCWLSHWNYRDSGFLHRPGRSVFMAF